MTTLDKYLQELAKLRSTKVTGYINVSRLLDLEENHLPRIAEVIRLLQERVYDFASLDDDEYNDQLSDAIAKSIRAIDKINDIVADGLAEVTEAVDEKGDLN